MSINFFEIKCQIFSNKKIFGLCDDPSPSKNKAYIDEQNGANWIAVVENQDKYNVTFTAIDNCIEIKRYDGKMASRCDGVLTFNQTIIFVELKQRSAKGNAWVEDAEEQLKQSIYYFDKQNTAENFTVKKAYAANSKHPKFKISQTRRMNQFFKNTGYVLRIENRITLTEVSS